MRHSLSVPTCRFLTGVLRGALACVAGGGSGAARAVPYPHTLV